MQSGGKQKPEVLSQPYWCWSLICMCYQTISQGTYRLMCTRTHPHTHTHAHKCVQMQTPWSPLKLLHSVENNTQRLRIFSLNTDAYLLVSLCQFPLTFTRTPFPPKPAPLCTRQSANMQVLQKKSAYSTVVGKERWELLISYSAFLSLSKYIK